VVATAGEDAAGAASPARPRTRLSAAVLGSRDARGLASFYERLLGWVVVEDHPGWVRLRHPSGELAPAGLSFADEPGHVPPVWPTRPGEQQMMVHLDVAVDDLEAGVAWALDAGATLAPHQPQEHVRVLLDPAGHPFCLFLGEV
jgi:catechol 2,3-dioxygenase-like lactoylglutathione lyase family enzyme